MKFKHSCFFVKLLGQVQTWNQFCFPPVTGRGERTRRKNNNNKNKTWSSVSNSSLSKTFVLCQFRMQKLCFLPPNIVLGLKKRNPKILLVRKKFWGGKKISAWKRNFGSKKNWVWQKFVPEKNLGPKKFGPRKIWVWKNVGSKIFCCCSNSSCDLDP